MTKYTISRGEDEEGSERFWYSFGDGRRSAIFASFEALLEELVPAFNFQRSHNVSATVAYGPDEGVVFLQQPDGGLFQLGSVSFAQQEKLWNALTAEQSEETA